jgi:hypothetical protein
MRKRYILFIAIGVVLVLTITFLFQATTIYNSQVIVKAAGGAIGIAPFTDRIDFGDVPQGQEVGKTLVLENEGAVPNQVIVLVFGGIGDLVKVEPTSFNLEPGESQEVEFRLVMPSSAEPEKKYTGKVIILRFPTRPF